MLMYAHLSISLAKQSTPWTSKILATSHSRLLKTRPIYGREMMIAKSILWTNKASKINTIQKNGENIEHVRLFQHGRCKQKFVHIIKDENKVLQKHMIQHLRNENRYSFIKTKGRRPSSKNPWL